MPPYMLIPAVYGMSVALSASASAGARQSGEVLYFTFAFRSHRGRLACIRMETRQSDNITPLVDPTEVYLMVHVIRASENGKT